MGFNIEQYELNYNESWNNISGNDALRGAGTICVKGSPIYGIPLTYAGFQLTKKGRAKISENRQICQARYATKKGTAETSIPASEDVVSTSTSDIAETPKNAVSSGTIDAKKSNTGLYIGIGAGVFAIAIVTIVLLTRKK
jgi:hypothetical protein